MLQIECHLFIRLHAIPQDQTILALYDSLPSLEINVNWTISKQHGYEVYLIIGKLSDQTWISNIAKVWSD